MKIPVTQTWIGFVSIVKMFGDKLSSMKHLMDFVLILLYKDLNIIYAQIFSDICKVHCLEKCKLLESIKRF